MFLSRNSLPAEASSWVERFEKVQRNLINRTQELQLANRDLAKQIAERQLMESALRQAEEKYRSIFENAVEGIFQSTPAGNYISANPALARIYGYDSPEELSENLQDIGRQLYVDPKRREEFLRLLEENDRVSEFESQVYRKDGSIIWISENARAVRDRTGKLLYSEGFVTDITKRKSVEDTLRQSEAKFKQQAEQLEHTLHELQQTQGQLIQSEKMSSLGQLVAGVAHEINNPVNFVCGNLIHASQYGQDLLNLIQLYQQHYPNPISEIEEEAENIDFDFLKEDFPKTLSSMQVGADRIRQIVQSLRNFSRIDEAQMKPVDIHEGIDSTLLILHSRIKPKGIANPGICVIKEYGDLPKVECYAGLLNQVFMNLLSNAIEALDDYNNERNCCGGNGITPAEMQQHPSTIRIITEVIDRDWVAIRIVDNGPGMCEEVKGRIFDPFFTTKPVGKGTGLGLAISYQIVVEKHHGNLRCNSVPEQGTEFVIEIPLVQ
ncbi:PAS domain S-box protein [Microcoleus sp. FACHB-831]|uniref:sensor histidine kinase n=1 Tax=Microcoleus sp. FACHB-831 TaxID=2692827 RepID=UPI001683B8F4|nr:ATP-binding protein [Microcoleus sp. FACHB-831]MBD1920217.1 PAS domain S-box protein [Microcoleus sp. FACHB-831]